MRVLCATTANDGHFVPLQPFARACAAGGHEVRVAAPASYAAAVERAGFRHESFAVLGGPAYAAAACAMASAIGALPDPSEVVPVLVDLAG